MFIVENSIHVALPLARVWRVLADVDRYRDWHPFVALQTKPDTAQKVGHTFRKFNKPYFSSEADVVELKRHHVIAYRIGIRGLFELEERFTIEKEGQGTQLVHAVRGTGCLSFVGTRFFKKGARNLLTITDASLSTYLKRGTTAARYSHGKSSR